MLLQAKQIKFFTWQLPLRWYRRIALANAFSIWMLIVLGGLVRVTESGTGCGSSWPLCNGSLIPSLDYHLLIEWNHRLFATLGGILMATTVLSTLIWYRKPRLWLGLALLAGVAYIAQAVVGALTVILELGHSWTAIHMGNSMILLASVILLAFFSRSGPAKLEKKRTVLHWVTLGVLIWTYIALFSGSAVASTETTIACPDWPQCSGAQILPENRDQWINFGHRIAVGMSDTLLLVVGYLIWRQRRSDRRLMNMVRVLGACYIGQVFLGAFTIWLDAPAALKGAHLAVAALTWASLVLLTTFVWIGPKAEKGEDGNSPSGPAPRRRLIKRVQDKIPVTVQNYLGLMRPTIIPLLLVPTVAAMLMAAVQHPPQGSLLLLIIRTSAGGTLATGGAHAINQYLDRDIDARMKRTRRRAVVSGKISPTNALIFGIALSVAGVGLLLLTVNPLAAALALSGNLFYIFVYTLWLKRTSTQNIVIGGAAGSVPPLVGWAAVTGRVDLPAILFFAIIFFWTPAHFWALALVRSEEYAEAGVPMLPVVKGEAVTRQSILLYAVLLVAATLVPFALNALSWLYLGVAVVLGVMLVRLSLALLRNRSKITAWKLFKFSNTYLAALYAVMVIDRLLSIQW